GADRFFHVLFFRFVFLANISCASIISVITSWSSSRCFICSKVSNHFSGSFLPKRPIDQAAVARITGRTSLKQLSISGKAEVSPRFAKAIKAFLCNGFFPRHEPAKCPNCCLNSLFDKES